MMVKDVSSGSTDEKVFGKWELGVLRFLHILLVLYCVPYHQ